MLPSSHPASDVLWRFAHGTVSREERKEVVAHLLRRCTSCAATIREEESFSFLLPKPGRHDRRPRTNNEWPKRRHTHQP